MPAKGGKGTTWTPELERRMLILAITAADLKPSTATWNLVAQGLGSGLTASAVSQKFAKLKKAIENETDVMTTSTAPPVTTPPVTPQPKKTSTASTVERKRKAAATVDNANGTKKKKPKQVKTEPLGDEHFGSDEKRPNHNAVDQQAQNGHTTTGIQATAGAANDAGNIDTVTGDGQTRDLADDGANGIKVEDNSEDEAGTEAGDEAVEAAQA